jgi:hypothetical protein
MNKGLPLAEAEREAAGLEVKIRSLADATSRQMKRALIHHRCL